MVAEFSSFHNCITIASNPSSSINELLVHEVNHINSLQQRSIDTFDIRNHLDKLTPAKGKNRYECPGCGGDNLTINPETGAYQCWNYEGDKQHLAEIREAIAPWSERQSQSNSLPRTKRQTKPKPAPIPDAPIKLARFPEIPKDVISTGQGETRYPYGENRVMVRISKPDGDKICFPMTNGVKGKPDQVWAAYRESEILQFGKQKWVLGVEGERCSETARGLGIFAWTMQASDWGQNLDNPSHFALLMAMQRFKQAEIAGVVYFPDNDETGFKKAKTVSIACALSGMPCIILDPLQLVPAATPGWDIADWAGDSILSADEIVSAIESSAEEIKNREAVSGDRTQNDNIKTDQDDENWKPESTFNPDAGNFGDSQQEACKHKVQILKVKKALGRQLRFNEMTQQVERNGLPFDLDAVHLDLAEEFNIQITKSNAPDIVLRVAKENSYHPVKKYLLANYDSNKNIDFSILNDISTRYFGTTEDIYNVMMKKTLIGAVARVLDPGCKFDTATILQGDQDIKKSTFWATLAGQGWFDDTFDDIENKDDLSKLTRYWCVEFAEFENVTTKKAAGAVKKFLSTKSDRYRVPYGRAIREFPRTSFIVGSVNPVGILNDPTGDRRFWVIPVKRDRFNQIDIKRLERERDLLWAAAVKLYLAREIFHLTDVEKALASESNKDFQTQDSWEPYITAYLQDKSFVTVGEILTDVLGVEIGKQDRTAQSRVCGILRRSSWEQTISRHCINVK